MSTIRTASSYPIVFDDLLDVPFTEEIFVGYIVPEVKSIAFHEENKTTVVRWSDGTKTVVRCGEGENWSEYSAFVAALAKRMFGSTSAVKKIIDRCDLKKIAQRKEEAVRAERQRQDEAAKRNRENRIRRMAREMVERQEAFDLAREMADGKEAYDFLLPREMEGPQGEDGANG